MHLQLATELERRLSVRGLFFFFRLLLMRSAASVTRRAFSLRGMSLQGKAPDMAEGKKEEDPVDRFIAFVLYP